MKRKGFSIRCALAGLIVVVGASVAAWLIFGHGGVRPVRPTEEGPTRKIADAGTNAASRASASLAPEAEPEQVKTNAFVVKRYGHSSNVPSDDTTRVHRATMNGISVVGPDGVARSMSSTPIFKTRIDNMLWAAVRPGGMPSGLNALRSRMRAQTGSDAAFLQALRQRDIEVLPDDPPHVVEAKNETLAMKDEIVAALDAGRSFDDIYRELSSMTRDERAYQSIVREDLRKIMSAGDAEALRKYAADMNPVLKSKGLREIRVPSWAAEGAERAPAERK